MQAKTSIEIPLEHSLLVYAARNVMAHYCAMVFPDIPLILLA